MNYLKYLILVTLCMNFSIMNSVASAALPDSTSSNNSFKNDGETIKNIYIDNIDVSGPSLEDGNEWTQGIFGKVGNALHIKTKIWVIQNILLFKTGEKLDTWKINESERLLRKAGYFYDAKIRIENSDEKGKVDIRVVTKDKWTLNPQISYSPKNSNGYLGFKDKNFLGLGQTAELNITNDSDPYIRWGGQSGYTISNIKGSYVNAAMKIESNHKSNMLQLSLNRSFYTINTRWIGGLNFAWQHNDFRFINNKNKIGLIPFSYDSEDLWIGRSFSLWFGPEEFRNNSSLIISGRYFRKHFRLRPTVLPDSNRIFEDSRLYIFSLGAIHRQYFKSFYVDDFGVTEDIPVGGLISVTTGSDEREFYNRWYYGMQIIYSTQLNTEGYFSWNFEIGGFRYQDKWEQSAIKFKFNYHSPLFYKKNWKARFFLQNNFVSGSNRFEGEQIYLDHTKGMPGFNELVLPGTKRNVLNLEMRIFSPYSVLGFILGGIAFADYGLISEPGTNLLSSHLYQGYGLGLRTQNESISETKFELAVVYNPFNPSYGKGGTEIVFSASFALGSSDFNFDEPKTINFLDQNN